MKAIFFDAGNTLVWFDHAFLAGVLGEHGVRVSVRELQEAEYAARAVLDEHVRAGTAGDNQSHVRLIFAEVFRRLGVPDEVVPAVTARIKERHAESSLWCIVQERSVEALEELRARGYALGVISNSDGRMDALLGEVGLREHFDFVIDSADAGVEKPDPRIFRMACEKAGVEPAEACYVGDLYEIDVAGARAAGMRAFLMDPLGLLGHLDCERIAGIHELPERLG